MMKVWDWVAEFLDEKRKNIVEKCLGHGEGGKSLTRRAERRETAQKLIGNRNGRGPLEKGAGNKRRRKNIASYSGGLKRMKKTRKR